MEPEDTSSVTPPPAVVESPTQPEVQETAPVLATPPVEAPVAKAPKIKGLTIGGMKKRVAIKRGKPESATELREQMNELLMLLVTTRDGNKRHWVNLKNADGTGAMSKLEARLHKLRFYVWRTIGEAHYLMTGHLTGSAAVGVAYILPEGRGYKWTIANSRCTSGTENSLQKSKEVVMLYRDQFPA